MFSYTTIVTSNASNALKEFAEVFNSGASATVPNAFHVDVRDVGDKYILEAELAGVKRENISLRYNVSGEQGNRKMAADRPGYTIRAECHGNIQFHYSLPRRISMREAARIQSFPDSFIFPCGLRETERQIGNAVPPVLGWHMANAVKNVLQR